MCYICYAVVEIIYKLPCFNRSDKDKSDEETEVSASSVVMLKCAY